MCYSEEDFMGVLSFLMSKVQRTEHYKLVSVDPKLVVYVIGVYLKDDSTGVIRQKKVREGSL